MGIHLYTTFSVKSVPDRENEFLTCLEVNLDNLGIDAVTVFTDLSTSVLLSKSKKLKVVEIPQGYRPFYTEIFDQINLDSPDISIIANGDIFFNQEVEKFQVINRRECWALSRWDVKADGSVYLHNRRDSQDVWVFRGEIPSIKAKFEMGIAGCDNRLAHELSEVYEFVSNPSKTIRSFHLHLASIRDRKLVIPPPYRYLIPEERNPFLTIVTRKHPSRPGFFGKNVESVESQTSIDYDHIILEDKIGLGAGLCNILFFNNKNKVLGKYVFILDDDDALTNPNFVRDMKNLVADNPNIDVIMFRMLINGELYPTNFVWGKKPVLNHIGSFNYIMKKELWVRHIQSFIPVKTGDYNFISTVFEQERPTVIWHDVLYGKTLRVSKGRAE